MTPRITIVLALWIAFAGPVLGCSCVLPAPAPCQDLSRSDVVFVGTVVDIENPPPEIDPSAQADVVTETIDESGYSRYRFRIDETIFATQTGEIDVFSGRGSTDCSYHFQKGRQYLVFPGKSDDGRLVAGICSDTRPVEFARGKLAVLRAMRDHQPVASLYGSMRIVQQPYGSVLDVVDYVGKPVVDRRLILRSDGGTLEAKTDANGNYAFFNVPAGTYHVEADLPRHLEIGQRILSGPPPPIELRHDACYEHDVEVLPTGRIRGKVLGPDGHPLRYASVELYRQSRYREGARSFGWWESQDAKRPEFTFEHVAPGDYLLVYNGQGRIEPTRPYPRMFYPGVADLKQAQLIHLEEGQDAGGLEFRLPQGRTTRAITVRLVAPDGQLPDLNYVRVLGDDGSALSGEEESRGVYRILVFPGKRYRMQGAGYCSASEEELQTAVGEVAGSETGTTELTLTFPRACPQTPDSDEDGRQP